MKQNTYTTIQCTAGDVTNTTTPNPSSVRRGIGLRTALAALLIATAAACSDKEDFGNGNGDDGNTTDLVTVRFSSVPAGEQTPGTAQSPSCQGGVRGGSPETRTTIRPDGKTVWWTASTDRIGISAVPDPGNTNGTTTEENKQYAPATDGETAQFKPAGEQTGEMQLTPGTYTFYSYYPWGEYDYVARNNSKQFFLEDFVQDGGNNTDHIGAQDFMWATATATVSDGNHDPADVAFTYSHAFPMLRIINNTAQTITRICVRSETDPVKGKATISLTDGKITDASGQEIFLDITGGLAEGDTASLLILPQTREGGELFIDLMAGDGTINEVRKPLPSGGLIGGKAYLIDFEYGNGAAYTTYTVPSRGDGTPASPYEIDGPTDLRWLAMAVSYFGKTSACAKLIPANSKIDLGDSYWVPIGRNGAAYSGTFDGNGVTVSGLNVNRTEGYAGFFGKLAGTVSNLCVKGSVTVTDQYMAGGITGYAATGSSITNCVFIGDVKGLGYTGGIAGSNYGSITGCYATGTAEATKYYAGGIAGNSMRGSTIGNCYSSATVTAATNNAGGIVGDVISGTVTTCYATGTVSAPERAGGIVGQNSSGTIKNCIALNTDIVRTSGEAVTFGRVAGVNKNTDDIQNCAAWNGMTVLGNTITTGDGATTIHGKGINATECLTKATYTSYSFNTGVWDFEVEDETFQYHLPWNKVLDNYWDLDVLIDIPQKIRDARNAGN